MARLAAGFDIRSEEVVAAEQKCLMLCAGEEVRALSVENPSLATAGDEALSSIFTEGRLIERCVRFAAALLLFRVVGGDVDDFWRIGVTNSVVVISTLA